VRVLARAQILRNVSQACTEVGISRTLFYRWRRRYLAPWGEGLYSRRQGPRWGQPALLRAEAERTTLALALA
jgi:transposase-like protein